MTYTLRGVGEPYGLTPWEVLETWTWERIATILRSRADEADMREVMRKRAEKHGPNTRHMTLEQWAGTR